MIIPTVVRKSSLKKVSAPVAKSGLPLYVWLREARLIHEKSGDSKRRFSPIRALLKTKNNITLDRRQLIYRAAHEVLNRALRQSIHQFTYAEAYELQKIFENRYRLRGCDAFIHQGFGVIKPDRTAPYSIASIQISTVSLRSTQWVKFQEWMLKKVESRRWQLMPQDIRTALVLRKQLDILSTSKRKYQWQQN